MKIAQTIHFLSLALGTETQILQHDLSLKLKVAKDRRKQENTICISRE